MGKAKRVRRFAQVKRIAKVKKAENNNAKTKLEEEKVRHVARPASSMFFAHNKALGPPYNIIVDTNFINKSIQVKLDIVKGMMDCLFARCNAFVTDCVIAEIEKLGPRYRIALSKARDESVFERLPCIHKGTYADDCILQRVMTHPCYIVATNDKELKCRIRKVPGIPIMYVSKYRYAIERLPEGIM